LPAPPPEVTAVVPGHPGVTYLSLLKQVIPNLAYNAADRQAQGHLKSLRHILGKDSGSDPPDPVVAGFVEARTIKAGGKTRLALLVDLGQAEDSTQSTTLLALYDDAPRPKLLDAVDVGADKETGLDDHPSQISLGPGDDALVVYSGHGNSNQSYQSHLVIFVRNDRFQLLSDTFVLSDNGCGYDRKETPIFATTPGQPYAALVVTVTETLTRSGDDCGDQSVPKPYKRIWRTIWKWDAAAGRFVDTAHGLDKLDKLNQGRL
jgi:hypothetical protein